MSHKNLKRINIFLANVLTTAFLVSTSMAKPSSLNYKTSCFASKLCPPDNYNCMCNVYTAKLSSECIPRSWVCDGWEDCTDGSDEIDCTCVPGQFQCACDENEFEYERHCSSFLHSYYCISNKDVCNTLKSCPNSRDELIGDCHLSSRCLDTGIVISQRMICNGYSNCDDQSDENRNCSGKCSGYFRNNCDCNRLGNFTCLNFGCYSDRERCDGRYKCSDKSDEWNCPIACPAIRPNRCACNNDDKNSCVTTPCYSDTDRCDGVQYCEDFSDEWNCTTCSEQLWYDDNLEEVPIANKIPCACNQVNDFTCTEGFACFFDHQRCGGYLHCADHSDEWNCSKCPLDFPNRCTCSQIDNFICTGKASCFSDYGCASLSCNDTNVLCTSFCGNNSESNSSCQTAFRCANGDVMLTSQFCNGVIDCPDKSDEIKYGRGFKCFGQNGNCVLPQINIAYDTVAHCKGGTDVCSSGKCFKCFDNRLFIASSQVCDGMIDCYDISDECLCESAFDAPVCKHIFANNAHNDGHCGYRNLVTCFLDANGMQVWQEKCKENTESNFTVSNSTIRCQSKPGYIIATLCDGRPECRDLSDECSCDNLPKFCNDSCHRIYPLGDRYCDGHIDQAWVYINQTRCPEDFDELHCPQRRTCKAGNRISIDVSQWCDGKVNCDDGSDEKECKKSPTIVFSSNKELVSNIGLRISIWVIDFFTITGNIRVFLEITREILTEGKTSQQNILILNLSIADFLMGVYLTVIIFKSVEYSGIYGEVDYEWRSSTTCSIAGILVVVSSEASCVTMVTLSGFRLHSVFHPFTPLTSFTLKISILVSWFISIFLAVFPVLNINQQYFLYEVWISNQFTNSNGWKMSNVVDFSCRLAGLSNNSLDAAKSQWTAATSFLSENFPQYSPRDIIGYYGETSVCMPRLFVALGGENWEYSLALITTNFVAFLFVLLSYILIYKKASNRPCRVNNADGVNRNMQKRIGRLIFTDFLCWIPICTLAYIRLGGFDLSPVAYSISAIALLPINSALNPILYSTYVVKGMKRAVVSAKSSLSFFNKANSFNLEQVN